MVGSANKASPPPYIRGLDGKGVQQTNSAPRQAGRLAQVDVVSTEELHAPAKVGKATTHLGFEAASQVFIYTAKKALRSAPLVQDVSVGSQPGRELRHQGMQVALRVLRRAHPELGPGLVVGHDLTADLSHL